ncbi:MAG TPA: DNA-3-methyladenine glycosylase [Nitrospirota bacterium]|nr:DNA-3-methyladenine glycosylase [Nitrospirota bacterium]
MRKIGHSFFQRDAIRLARDLIGTILVRRIRGKEYRARIVETEAYVGPLDLASHSSKGRTKRTEVLFGPRGHAYVYLIYGMYEMFNIVAYRAGSGQAVLIRAAEPLDNWKVDLSGPGKLARGFKISRSENGLDLTGDALFLLHDPGYRPRIGRTRRVGVDYAKEWKDALLRFFDANSAAVSARRHV